ncbi:hypothetical protein I5M32_13545 [Pedobacter sp. SD-b]|uniref:MerR HTH family regulatory protein n=1 Tax=Pedobacter segetis TaxID=2793069 RepID=A0ABS1BM64_9SPHI|nr:chaperone modulator CbpM [Pedobacter segetis]MBK0383987.1 hypothetical protein [Pedobacter segetis]
MTKENYIPIATLCTHYNVEMSLIKDLDDNGLIPIIQIEKSPCIHQDFISSLEKMLRLHEDLQINVAGIDTIFNLLNRVEAMQLELRSLKNRLKIYEDE